MTRLIHWHEGMFMRVQSLQMFQQGVLERFEELRRTQHHYPYGVIEAQLASDALAAGKVQFTRLHAVLPNGFLVQSPEECDLAALPVREAIARSRSGEVLVLLGIPDYNSSGQNTFRLGEVPNPQVNFRYIPRDEPRLDENTGDNKQAIIVRSVNARLMLENDPKAGLECLPLVKVRKASSGTEFRVEMASGFAPPCLYLPPPLLSGAKGSAQGNGRGAELSLPHRLAEEVYLCVQQIEVARRQANSKIQDHFLGSGAPQGEQVRRWLRFLILTRHAARLQTLQITPLITPFDLFLALYEALRELEASKARRGAAAALEYNHEEALPTFQRLRARLEKALEEEQGVEFFESAFEVDQSVANRIRAKLRPEFFGNNVAAWFLAVQCPLAVQELANVLENRKHFELTSPGMIDLGFGGLQLRHKPLPPPGLPGAVDLHYFQVELSNDALIQQVWSDVKSNSALAINRGNPLINLNDAAFTFYAILHPKALDTAAE